VSRRFSLLIAGSIVLLAAIGGAVPGYVVGHGSLAGLGGFLGAGIGFVASVLWAVADRRRQGRLTAATARSQILDLFPLPPMTGLRPSSLLSAERGLMPFRGHAVDMAWLKDWCLTQAGPPLCVLSGAAGVGKTRTVLELAKKLPSGWVVGRLRLGQEAGAVQTLVAGGDPTLVIIEAANWGLRLVPFLQDLHRTRGGMHLRAVVVTRNSNWLTALRGRLAETEATVLDQARIRELEAQGSPDDLRRWFGEALKVYAEQFGRSVPRLVGRGPQTGTSMGELQARALLTILADSSSGHSQPDGMSAEDVAVTLAAQERRQWPDLEGSVLSDIVRDRCVSTLVLLGARNEDDAAAVLRRVPDLGDAPEERLRDIARWVHQIYPGYDPEWIAAPEPDLVVAGILVPSLQESPGLQASLVSSLSAERLARVIGLLLNVGQYVPWAHTVLEAALREAGVSGFPAEVMERLTEVQGSRQLDQVLEQLIRAGAIPLERLWELHLVLDKPELVPHARVAIAEVLVTAARGEEDLLNLATAIDRLGTALAELGRYEESLAALREAVGLWREAATANPRYRSELATAIGNLGGALYNLGRDDEMLAATQEAVKVWREAATANPTRYRPELAGAVGNLGLALGRLGRYEESLAALQEAVGLWREAATSDPRYWTELGGLVVNLGLALSQVGRYKESLAALQEAVELWREAAIANPTRYRPDLAGAVGSLGPPLGELGRYEESLAALQEAVELWREAVAANPTRYRPDLAVALTSLGVTFSRLGRDEESLAALREAVGLWREAATANPTRYRPELAAGLTNLGGILGRRGRYEESLAALQEAAGVWREAEAANPAEYRPALASGLTNLGATFGQLGRYQESLAAMQEAVELWREAAAAKPARYRPELAAALHNLAASLEQLSRHEEALATERESPALADAREREPRSV